MIKRYTDQVDKKLKEWLWKSKQMRKLANILFFHVISETKINYDRYYRISLYYLILLRLIKLTWKINFNGIFYNFQRTSCFSNFLMIDFRLTLLIPINSHRRNISLQDFRVISIHLFREKLLILDKYYQFCK